VRMHLRRPRPTSRHRRVSRPTTTRRRGSRRVASSRAGPDEPPGDLDADDSGRLLQGVGQ
jgi:hypothetical protein